MARAILTENDLTIEGFGARLRAARERADLTLEELGRKVQSSKAYIWELENKPSIRPSADLVHRLATALGVSMESLLGEAEPSDAEGQVFFRSYKKLSDPNKQKLKDIMDILSKDN